MTRPDLIEKLCGLLRGPESKRAAEALNLDSSEVSRFLSGQRGLNRDQIGKAIELCDLALVSRGYLDAVCLIGQVGMHCECARRGSGECGRG
ncbi:DNA-binding protein [Robbsia andropogonis]|uniref:DNA-binding protein n=1 Tax=Robbsia andropogonis TaxID=28092 RepID=A0A0F5JV86_9BURK|nr:hypothetical protein [Robbsia andropogonis]KKB61529.1 DNA-binding protein [Robbsia andropogonis]